MIGAGGAGLSVGAVGEILDDRQYQYSWPGHGVSDDNTFQFNEMENIRPMNMIFSSRTPRISVARLFTPGLGRCGTPGETHAAGPAQRRQHRQTWLAGSADCSE
jgi:hypothetical protein